MSIAKKNLKMKMFNFIKLILHQSHTLVGLLQEPVGLAGAKHCKPSLQFLVVSWELTGEQEKVE